MLSENIDYIILFFITVLLVSLTFAPTSIIGMLAVICILLFLLKRGKDFTHSDLDLPIFLYIVIAGISVGFSSLFIPALKGYSKLIIYFFCYLAFFNVLRNKPKRSWYILGVIAITAFAESLVAIFQQFIGIEALATWQDKTNINPEQIMTRVYGTLQPFNPNLLAGYLVASVSAAGGLFFLFAHKGKVRLATLSLIAFLSIMVTTVFTGSRGAYLGLAAILACFVLFSGHVIWHDIKEKAWLKKLWLYIVIIGGIAALCLVLSSPALQHRILSIFAFREDSSNAFRLNVYAASLKMFFDNWLIGIGPGNEVFRQMYGLYMRSGFDALAAYSVPLEIAVESGIFALFAFVWLIISIFIKGIKTLFFEKNIDQKILILTCVASIMGIIIHGMVDTIFFRPQVQILFWVLVAILCKDFVKQYILPMDKKL